MPGGADNEESLCALVCRGENSASEIPILRWPSSTNGFEDCHAAAAYGSFSRNCLQFDVTAFGISSTEASFMDPQMALLLEVGWAALKSTGQHHGSHFDGFSAKGTQVGVFLGMGGNTVYHKNQKQTLVRSNDTYQSVYSGTSNALSIASGRISFTLGLTGPCLTLDTACSSSLVATHLAAASV